MKLGWWKLIVDVRVGDMLIGMEELPKEAQKKIMQMVAGGCVAGEIEVPDDWTPMDCEEGDLEKTNCEAGTYDCETCILDGRCARQDGEDIPLF